MKKKKVAKILALLLATTMMIAGCGGNGDGGSSESSSQSANESSEAPQESGSEEAEGGEESTTPADEGGEAAAGEPIKNLNTWASVSGGDLSTLILQHSEGTDVATVGGNCLSPLLEFDNYGSLVPAVAKEWGTEDEGQTWTFKLRDDIVYVDVNGNELGKCTAQDWITSLEWILNFHKNGGLNTSMPVSTIAGAQEYYDYTKDLSEEEAKTMDNSKFLEMVGIEAPDDYTLIYHCLDKVAYFDTLATGACLYPMPQGMIDKVGVDGVVGISNEDYWYSGPYRLTTFVPNNERVYTRNESYWDKDCTLFDTVTVKMIESGDRDDELWETGEVDHTELSTAKLTTILNDPSNQWNGNLAETRVAKFSYALLFNYYKLDKDGNPDENWNKAVANDAFRLSLYWGLDLSNIWYLTNQVNPLSLENLAYSSQNLGVFSDGKDYVNRVIELLDIPEGDGTKPRRYNQEKGEQYKQQAMEELGAEGVTFPIQIDYFIKAGDQTALDSATIYKETFEALGTDYVNFNINTYVSSAADEVRKPQLQSFDVIGWGADFGDISNFVNQGFYNDDAAIYSVERFNLDDVTDAHAIEQWEEYTRLGRLANAETGDKDKRLEAFAQAEAYLVNNAMVIPWNYSVKWQLTKVNDYSKMYAAYGISDIVYKNWETSTVPYTAEDYERFKAEYEAGGK